MRRTERWFRRRRRAKPGEYIVMFLLGMGPTSNPVASGVATPTILCRCRGDTNADPGWGQCACRFCRIIAGLRRPVPDQPPDTRGYAGWQPGADGFAKRGGQQHHDSARRLLNAQADCFNCARSGTKQPSNPGTGMIKPRIFSLRVIHSGFEQVTSRIGLTG